METGRPSDATFDVLVLCTGNSARSILAECLLEREGAGRIRAFSAGSHPKSAPHPQALALLERRGFETSALRSKSWDEFAGADAPHLDLIVTVCNAARDETCPVWPGAPLRAHWGLPDPAACEGSEAEIRDAFERAYRALEHRIRCFSDLPFASLDRPTLQREIDRIATLLPADDGS